MSASPTFDPYEETIVPRAAVSFPAKLPLPDGFDPDRLETWPKVHGRLEYYDGALWYLPPCGSEQQFTTVDVVVELGRWQRSHPEFRVGGNEAGMKLGDDVRGAEAAVWRRDALPSHIGPSFPRVPPLLAVEVAGKEDTVELLGRRLAGTSRTASRSSGFSSRARGCCTF